MKYSFSEDRNALELFCAGDSVRAYDFFGAHLVNRDGRDGVVFRVWAPNALSVSVVGSFNNWNKTSDYMYKIGNGSWEVFIEGIKPYDIYKYCIETPWFEKCMKSDPFAFHTETRPDNASIVYNIAEYVWGDEGWFDYRSKCDSIKSPMNIYEIHAGSWKRYPDGNFFNYRKLADELVPYLKEMHYTHVQLMPITEYPFDGSWGFQTTGYFAPTSRYGTPGDFMYFVDTLHKENIGVILDWVPSNFPKDTFGLVKFDGTCLYESEDPCKGERPAWGTCLFDFSKSEVISFLVSSAMFWIEKFHIDGMRVGALSSMLYLDYGKKDGEWTPNQYGGKENLEAINFIKHLNTAVHMFHPDVLMFAEENTSWPKLTHPVEEGGLGFDYKWNMGWMNDMLHYMSLNPLWRPFNHDNLTYSFFYAFSEHFLLPISHDEVSHGKGSLINKMPGEYDDKFSAVRAFITYMYAHPGKKLVFMGTEIGQFDEWDADSGIQWDLLSFEKHSALKRFFCDLNKFYLENKPLYELDAIWKGFDWIHHDDYTNSVIAFKRTDSDGNEIIAVCNFQPVKHEKYYIGVPKYGLYSEVFTSDAKEYGGTGVSNGSEIIPEMMKIHGCNQGLPLTLPPLGVIYLKCTGELEPVSQD
ncbi:1,4-alpha-glucan branching protein GlgB [uncultured Ruminococcus sp.]|uniref:1,4-alpha-glucan branching protein GlgB n=1 Tax=uncultured Ruminococcus sp. TaxID=165186 RepID=UPI0025DAD043|nr:1,4-alpha-glucan branching protein GlgB [uncultured Ruminococcus sp.]